MAHAFRKRTKLKPSPTLVLLLALSAFAWLPLVTPGYFMQAHDAPHSLFFLQAFDEVIRDGFWWPAWGPNFAFGYGYPLWIFYAPLAYYLGEAFHLLGLSITTSMKLVDLVATLGATLAMYAWARNHFGRPAAAFAALVYTYAPYHLLDLYVRSAVAEYFTFVWFPLALWRWELALQRPSARSTILAALVTAALVLTHHGAAFIFAALLAAYLIFLVARLLLNARRDAQGLSPLLHRLGHAFAAGLLALALSAIFWLPMLLEQRYIVVEQWTSVAYNYQKHFVFANQFFSPFWGFGYSGEWLNDDMSFQLGLMPLLGALIALGHARYGARRARVIFFALVTLVVVLLMSPLSAPFWQAVPVAALVQFPWRLLALSTITLAWLAGAALDALDAAAADELTPHSALLMLVVALASFSYTLPQYTPRSTQAESARAAVDFELVSFRDRTGFMQWASAQPQTSPLVAEYNAGAPLTKAVVRRGDAQIESLQHGGQSERVRVRAANESDIQFRIYYFPGWRATIDGRPAPLWPSGPQALITLSVPRGEHQVELRFEDTTVRRIGKWISVSGVLLIGAWALWRARRTRVVLMACLCAGIMLTGCGESKDSATPVTSLTPAGSASPPPTLAAVAAPSSPAGTNTAVPTSTTTPAGTPQDTSAAQSPTIQHVVQPNETVGGIAQKYGTTVDAILKANNLSDPRLLRAGQTLIIPLPTITPTPTATATLDATQTALPPTPTPNLYVVQPGDVLSMIAAKYNLPVDEIMAANGLKDTFLRAGQTLVIPPPTPTPTVTPTALPTATPTAGLAYSEPSLLFPPNGATFSSGESVVLNWTAVGALSTDEFYVLRLRSADNASRSESVWLKAPSYRLPETWRGGKVEWDVIVLQATKANADGTREGKIRSPFSQTRSFSWK